MEALNAVGLTPISVLSNKRKEPIKISPFSANFNQNPQKISRSFHGGLVLLSSVLNSGFAKALTYEEALQQSVTSPTLSDVDFGGFLDGVVNFGVENPIVVFGGAALLAVPVVLSKVLGKPKAWGVETAKSAYGRLGDDVNAQLVDIRPPVELRKVGSPDVRGLKKKPVSVVYNGEDKVGFLKKLALKFKEPENTTLIILDKFDGSSELVAELVTANGFKAAYAVKDGAEGARGWMKSGLPWILPKKALSFDLSNLTDSVGGALGEGSDAVPVTIAIAVATGLGLLAFTEVETILQLLGSAALIQFFSKKLLLAEDRKGTLQQIDQFLSTKVAPIELVDDIKQIGKAFLPISASSKALPSPAEASPSATESTEQITETVSESTSEPLKVEQATEPTPVVHSAPKTKVQAESLPGLPRPLSPYPYYPDLKPPTSPTPLSP